MSLEEDIGRSLSSRNFAVAARQVIEGYGPEVLGFLYAFLRSEDDAAESFQQACEDMWASIGRFEGRSSIRTWFYVLARHAAARLKRSPHARNNRNAPVSEIGELAARVRTSTAPYLRSEVKDAFAAIRDTLDEDDRAILILRVDRDLAWNEVAQILGTEAELATAAARSRLVARLRKRFQLIKAEVRLRAQAAGLVSGN